MTRPVADGAGAQLRKALTRIESAAHSSGISEIGDVAEAVREAARSAEELAGREKIYRETIRDQNHDLSRRIFELSVLRQIGDLIAGSLRVDDLFDRVLDVLAREFPIESCSVMTLDEETGELRVEAGRGPGGPEGDDAPRSAALKLGEGIAGWVASSRQPLVVNDVSRDVRFRAAAGGQAPRGSLACVPLKAGDRVLGVLNASSREPNHLDDGHRHILEIVTSQIAGALLGRQRYQDLRDRSGRLEDEVASRVQELEKRSADLRNKNEQVTQLYFSLETAQRELEERNRRLAEALTFNDNIVETVNVGIGVVNRQGKVLTWNRAMEKVTDGVLSKENVLGKKLEDIPEEAREKFGLGRSLLNAFEATLPVAEHNRVVEHEGVRRHLNVHHLPVSVGGGGGEHVIVVLEDVSSNVALHDQKVHAARLAAINETMVSVNHEVNNPLGVILGHTQMLLKKHECASDEARREAWAAEASRKLKTIESEVVRIGEITRKLSTLVEPVVIPYPAGEGGVRMVDVNRSR